MEPHRRAGAGRHGGDHHRRPPPVRDAGGRHAAVPGHQRERLGHEVEVRQPLRLPPLADRRHQPRHRRDDRRQDRADLRLRRRGQGLRAVPARPGRTRADRGDRPDLRAPGRNGRLPGGAPRGRGRRDRHLRHGHRQQGHHHGRPDEPHEAPGDRGQHRPLRQRDRHGRAPAARRRRAREHQAPGRRVALPRRPLDHRALGGPAAEPRQRHRPPELRDVELVHEPDDRPGRAVHEERRVREEGLRAPEAPGREGRPPAPGCAGREAHASSAPSRPPTSACRSRAPTSQSTTGIRTRGLTPPAPR